jgi:hypothetical protein
MPSSDVQGMGGAGRNADRRQAGVSPTARTRSVVSFSAQSAATMEDGGRHFSGSLSRRNDPEPYPRSGDSALEFHPQQRRLQRVCGDSFDLGGHAAGHARSAQLLASPMNQRRTIMRVCVEPIRKPRVALDGLERRRLRQTEGCVPTPIGIPSLSPGLRGAGYPGSIVKGARYSVSNPCDL